MMSGSGVVARGSGVRTWLGLGTFVLGLSGLMALLVALSRTPAVRPFLSETYFRVALVSHVDLFLVVWYMVMPVLLWRHLGLVGGWWERWSYRLMVVGVVGMVVPGVAGWGRPVMGHYIPYLVDVVFLGGIAVFLAGVGLAGVRASWGYWRSGEPLARAAGAGALCVVGALLGMLLVGVRMAVKGGWDWGSHPLLVFWVGGHLLQFAETALMLTVWGLLLGDLGCRRVDLRRALAVVQLFPVGVAVGVAGSAVLGLDELYSTRFLTLLKSWGLGVPAGLALPVVLRMWWEGRGARGEERWWRASVDAGVLVLGAGGLIGLFGDLSRQTTLIPAHYHGGLSAVALAYMGLSYYVLAREGVAVRWRRWAGLQPYLYSLGTVAFVAGMAWAGAHGAPRKTPGAAFAAGDAVQLMALNLWGLGALLSVAGGGAYLANVGMALWRWSGGEGAAARGAVAAEAAGRG